MKVRVILDSYVDINITGGVVDAFHIKKSPLSAICRDEGITTFVIPARILAQVCRAVAKISPECYIQSLIFNPEEKNETK